MGRMRRTGWRVADKAFMRVLHVISGLDATAGGTTAAVVGLSAAQAAAGMSVSVLSTWSGEEPTDTADGLRAAGVSVRLVGPATGRFQRHPRLWREMNQAVEAHDVVHIHAMWEEAQHAAARVARRRGKPYVVTPHGMLDPWSLRQSKWVKRVAMAWRVRGNLNHAAALHFTTTVERDLTRKLGLKPRAIIEPNGVGLREFETLPVAGVFRAKYPQLAGRRMILFLSRVHPKKGLDLLIPAFARVDDKNAMLVIAGPDNRGEHGLAMAGLATRLGVRDRIIFTGMLRGRDRVEALRDADLFALPSYQENFGIAVVESLAAGVPVIVSDQVNLHPEITAWGVGDVTATEVGAVAAALNLWLADEGLRAVAAERTRRFVWERYDWNAIGRRWAGHYEELMQRERRANPPAAWGR